MQDRQTPRRHFGKARLGSKHPAVPLALSFCSGFVDVTCFIGLYHSFTAFITGTAIIMCSELFRPDSLLWIRTVILSTFVVSAVVWVHVVRAMMRTQWPVVRICLALECLFLVLFAVSAMTLPVTADVLAAGTTLALVFATVATSLQNVTMQILLSFHTPTTVMTGNLMRFVVTTVERLSGDWIDSGAKVDAPDRKSAGQHYGYSLASFLVGGVLGAWSIQTIGFAGILLPAALLAAMALLTRD